METVLILIVIMLVPITAIVGGVVVKPWLELKRRQLELTAGDTAERAAQYAAHTERLEQRVRVLERIATDRGVDLAGEIDALRDDRQPH